jgi:hypothetical protein
LPVNRDTNIESIQHRSRNWGSFLKNCLWIKVEEE